MMHALLLFAGLAGPLLAGASSAEPVSYERPRVLVWEMQPSGVKASTAKAVEASVTRWAAKNPHLEVISHQDLGNLLKAESARQQLADVTDDRLAEIAKKADARLVIFGRVHRIGRHHAASLSLFDAARARAMRRERVELHDLNKVDETLGRAANALVGQVLDLPALDLRAAAADLVDQLPRAVFVTTAKVSTVRPLRYGTSTFTSSFGKRAAAEVAGAVRRRFKGKMALKPGLRLEGTYMPNHDMVELALVVARRAPKAGEERVVFKAQQRVIRAAVGEPGLVPSRLGQEEKDRVHAQTSTARRDALTVDAFTEKGSYNVVFTEGETFNIYLKANKTAYIRMVYKLAVPRPGCRPTTTHADECAYLILMEEAWPMTEDQVGDIVRYHTPFEAAPPFGVEELRVTAFTKRPGPLRTKVETIDGEEYTVIPTTRGFRAKPADKATTTISITTTGR
jgi:hypothetical protein